MSSPSAECVKNLLRPSKTVSNLDRYYYCFTWALLVVSIVLFGAQWYRGSQGFRCIRNEDSGEFCYGSRIYQQPVNFSYDAIEEKHLDLPALRNKRIFGHEYEPLFIGFVVMTLVRFIAGFFIRIVEWKHDFYLACNKAGQMEELLENIKAYKVKHSKSWFTLDIYFLLHILSMVIKVVGFVLVTVIATIYVTGDWKVNYVELFKFTETVTYSQRWFGNDVLCVTRYGPEILENCFAYPCVYKDIELTVMVYHVLLFLCLIGACLSIFSLISSLYDLVRAFSITAKLPEYPEDSDIEILMYKWNDLDLWYILYSARKDYETYFELVSLYCDMYNKTVYPQNKLDFV
ncbi:unnamed protein product [Bursaphelenchus okinawaensis]|uniref:Innexin n=1 Tax=Bursaphelenchus okinawaensis TaxID=465554 RepID=A0A811JSZ3_9BILA|nr:unnamed protein product [Bursaphelenchus okinawaensis]CAG9081882.1 unnamed protein product [Bursaphelenchus okinawaensis]